MNFRCGKCDDCWLKNNYSVISLNQASLSSNVLQAIQFREKLRVFGKNSICSPFIITQVFLLQLKKKSTVSKSAVDIKNTAKNN